MHHWFCTRVFPTALIWFSGSFLFAGDLVSPPARVEPDEIRKLLPPHVGAAVMAIDDGQVVFKHCWGKRRLDASDPVTSTTNFRLASVSKQFTATAILTLVEQGKIKFSDTLDRFFFDCPEYWKEITVHQLLTHTSGLPDYESLIPDGSTLQVSDYNVLAMLCETAKPKFAPGSKFAYSNSGYTLLGLIVETVSGRPYHEYLRAEVFEPAGMTRTVCYLNGMNQVPERAFGHVLDDQNHWQPGDQSVTSAVRGDGSIYSSLDDLEKWIAALEGGGLLSEELARAAVTPHVESDRGDEKYGYGWFIGEYRGRTRVWHNGSTRGFALTIQRFPERKAAVVILMNRSPPQPKGDYADRIVDRLLFEGTKP